MINTVLHITVGTSIARESQQSLDSALDISRELGLLKAALLYADQVKFCSIAPTALVHLLEQPSNLSEDAKLDWFLGFYQRLGHDPNTQKVAKFIEEYREGRRRKKKDFHNYLRYQEAFNKSLRDMRKMAKDAGADQLDAALNSGLVEFKPFATGGNAAAFLDEIFDAVVSGNTYPLLDEYTGDLVETAIREGLIAPVGTSVSRAKQAGLSSNLFSKLPLFDQATVTEILDIRKELDNPLRRFRAAIVSFSKEIDTLPWNKEFQGEVEQLIVANVEPTVLEIEETCKSRKPLLEIINRSLTHPGVVTSSVLGLALSRLSQFPELLVALSIAAGVTLGTYEAVKECREKIEEVEKNQLYFYYKVGKALSE
jgi:hypothetical protein